MRRPSEPMDSWWLCEQLLELSSIRGGNRAVECRCFALGCTREGRGGDEIGRWAPHPHTRPAPRRGAAGSAQGTARAA